MNSLQPARMGAALLYTDENERTGVYSGCYVIDDFGNAVRITGRVLSRAIHFMFSADTGAD